MKRRGSRIIWLMIVFIGMKVLSVQAQSLEHPIIWTTSAEKAEVMAKIENYSWAESILTKAKATVDSRVNTHVSNPVSILNTIPDFASDDNLSESQASSANAGHARVLGYAAYASMVYYLTEEEKYAQFAADILWYYIEQLAPRSPSNTAMSGSHFYDPRSGYAKFAISYDFMVNYLKAPGTKVYEKSTESMVDFDNEKAQKAVYNIAMNALHEHGGADKKYGQMVSNHPILRAPGVLFSILCVEDDVERERMFNVFWNVGTKEQNSFTKTILPMFGEQGIWPEAVSYSFMPNVTLVLNIVDRLNPEWNVMENNMHILDGNFLFDNLRHPNRRFVRYGDSHRDNDGTGNLYRYTLNLAARNGYDTYEQKAKVALKQAYDTKGGYNPTVSISTFDSFNGFSDLFWGIPIPNTVDGEIDFQKPTVVIKHAGVALQRNYVEANNSEYGLCGIIGGAHYVHSHCTGITMELYGAGYIMAANAGLPNSLAERKIPVHQNYFWRHAGNNTMIVNGTTHGIQDGAWNSNSYLWQNTTVNVGAEPEHLDDPISSNFSFATQFLDDRVNNDQQQRTLSTIRTSETTAYYFDMFRSKSLGENNFHDYIYHNVGDQTNISNEKGELMDVTPTNRYQNDIGDPMHSPGWMFFENTEVTEPSDKAVHIRFDVNYNERYMHLLMPGGVEREYTKALAPATREAKNGYDDKQTQVMAIRQQGEAWDKPYVAIFEPSSSETSSVVSVEHLYYDDAIIGAKVMSEVEDKTIEDFVLCLPNSNSSITLPEYDISFTGRYAVIRYEQDFDQAFTTLYMGEGDSLSYGAFNLLGGESRKGLMVQQGKPYFGRQLKFKNINNNQIIPLGTTLTIEALVGEEYLEATLWLNDTINLGTKTEAPFVWSGISELTNMQEEVYVFKLTATDAQGTIENEVVLVQTPGQEPFTDDGNPHEVPGRIQFEDYDQGGIDLGYYDNSTPDLSLYSYRDSDWVDFGRNGSVVASIEAGEWLEYTIKVKQPGFYKLSVNHSTTEIQNVHAFRVIQPSNGDTLVNDFECVYTGRGNYYLDNVGQFYLKQGEQVLRFAMLNSGVDLDYLELEYVSPAYRLMVESSTNGSVSISPQNEFYAQNDEVILTAVPDEGYAFQSWSGDYSSNENPLSLKIDGANIIISANFERASAVNAVSIEFLNVYPNPNDGNFIIKLAEGLKASYKIFGLDGSEVASAFIETTTHLKLDNLIDGVYLLQIKTDRGFDVRRLVICRT